MKYLLLVMMSLTLWGQSSAKVIMLRYLKVDSAMLIGIAFGDGKVIVNRDPKAQMIVVSGPPELLTAIETAIQKADVPDKPALNVELTFYTIIAGEVTGSSALPEELAGVAKQVKGLFGYPSLRLMDSLQVRARDGMRGEATGLMGRMSTSMPNYYQLSFGEMKVDGAEKAQSIKLSRLKFGTRIAIGSHYFDSGFTTDVDFREGQKIVIGKSSLDSSGTPFFVVVTGRVVD